MWFPLLVSVVFFLFMCVRWAHLTADAIIRTVTLCFGLLSLCIFCIRATLAHLDGRVSIVGCGVEVEGGKVLQGGGALRRNCNLGGRRDVGCEAGIQREYKAGRMWGSGGGVGRERDTHHMRLSRVWS